MAQLIKDGHTVETNHAPEIVALRSQGYKDVPAPKLADAAKTDAPKQTK